MNVRAQVERASAAERRFWFAEYAARGAPANIALGHIRIDGPVDEARLMSAVRAVRGRHPALRTAFLLHEGDLIRETRPNLPVPPMSARPMDLAVADVMRVTFEPDERGGDLRFAVHHIVFDGLSEGVLTADLAAAYDGAALPERPRTTEPRPSADAVQHWVRYLDGVADLPQMGDAPTVLARDDLAELRVSLDRADVSTACRDAEVSPFACLMTAFGRALSVISGAADFCVGTALSGRTPDNADEIGCLLRMVPIRMTARPGDVWAGLLDAMAHSDLPLEEIVRACVQHRGPRMPLYQSLFLLQGWPRPTHGRGPVTFRALPVPPRAPQAEVLLELYDDGDGPITGVLQAPAGGGWAALLPDLAVHLQSTISRRRDGWTR